jgi:hypothetical protein
MGYKRVEPVSVKKMLNKRYHGHHTICQKLRDIFVKTNDEDIKMDCRIAMAMAKSMHNKLKEYSKKEQERLNGD